MTLSVSHSLADPDLTELSLGDLVEVASAQPMLEEEHEDLLAHRAHEGDREARQRLLMLSLRIAIDEAIRTRGLGPPQRELVPAGVRALVAAIRAYHPALDGPFSRYVRAHVRRAMKATLSVS